MPFFRHSLLIRESGKPMSFISFCSLWSVFVDFIEQIGCRRGPSWSWSYGSWIYNYLCNQWLSSLMLWVRISIRARCATICDKVCQWLATGRWFSPGPPVSSTNKTDRCDISKILVSVVKHHQTNNQTNIKQIHCWICFVLDTSYL